jgi:MoaA/NifB/PqqE/SkfB family radical SAM enzyme
VYKKFPKSLKKTTAIFLYMINKLMSRPFSLNNITFYITWKCNAKCKFCFVWKNLNKEDNHSLSLEEIKKIFSSLKEKIVRVSCTGGEPFLRTDFPEICEVLYKSKHVGKIWSATNGIETELVYNQIEKSLKKIDIPLIVTVSLEGLEDTHDMLMGIKGAFKKAIETLKSLRKLSEKNKKFKVRALITVNKLNLDEVLALWDYIKSKLEIYPSVNFLWGSQISCFSLPTEVKSEFTPQEDLQPKLEKLAELNQELDRKLQIYENTLLSRIESVRRKYILKIIQEKRRFFPCEASLGKNLIIYPNGDVAFCEFTKPIGNLKETGFQLSNLIKSKNAKFIREKLKDCCCTLPYILSSSMINDLSVLKEILI